jgi:hypothetical protein
MRLARLGAALGACALAATVVSSPAGADQAEVYVGSASGRALALTVVGQTITLGTSTSKVNSSVDAVGDAAGQLAAIGAPMPSHSEATANGQSSTAPRTCAPVTLPAQVAAVVDVGVACSQSSASITGGNPSADAIGSVDTLGLSANAALTQVLSTLPIQNLADTLKPITGALPQGAQTTLNTLLTSVLKTKTLDVTLGASESKVVATAGAVTSTATAAGAVVKILPQPQVNGTPSLDPIATITIGPATATAVYDRVTAKATPTVDASLVRVDLNPTIAAALGVPASIAVPVDQDFAVPGLVGTPLETHIRTSHGSTATSPDGSVTATADAVTVQLAQGVQGGVTLQLANAQASVNGSPAVVTPTATPVAPATLAATGPTRPWLPIAGAGLLALTLLAWRPIRRRLADPQR